MRPMDRCKWDVSRAVVVVAGILWLSISSATAATYTFTGELYSYGEAIFPDGHTEVLTKYSWLHSWSLTYIYDDHVQPLLPKGTVLVLTSYYDNTANHPYNPDPDQWVVHGRRTGDEMAHIHLQIVSLDQEDFDRRIAERENLVLEDGG